MTSAVARIRQLLAHDTRDLIWLAYVMGIAPWMHRAARPMHLLPHSGLGSPAVDGKARRIAVELGRDDVGKRVRHGCG